MDWVGRTLEQIVEEALALKGLTHRQAAERTGLPYQRFSPYKLKSPPSPESVTKMAEGLDLPVDVLSVRSHRLPPGSEDDLDFQDTVIRAWRKHQRRQEKK